MEASILHGFYAENVTEIRINIVLAEHSTGKDLYCNNHVTKYNGVVSHNAGKVLKPSSSSKRSTYSAVDYS